MLWYYAWQCTANNSPKNGDFKGLFNINIATRANKKPSSHLMFEFHVGFGGCLRLILDISDYNDYNSTYCNSLTPKYKKTGRHPPFITSSKKVKDHRLFRISSPIQQLWVIQILFLLSLEADIETHILHKSYLYEAAIPPLKNVRHTVYLFRSQTFSSCLKKRFPRNPCCPWDSESNFWQQFLMMQRFLMGE